MDHTLARRATRRTLKQELRKMTGNIDREHPDEQGENTIEQPLGEDGVHLDGFCDERNNFGHNKEHSIKDIPGGNVADLEGERSSPNQFAGVPGPVDEEEIEFLFDEDDEEPDLDEPESVLD
jgi:hypothetical protein